MIPLVRGIWTTACGGVQSRVVSPTIHENHSHSAGIHRSCGLVHRDHHRRFRKISRRFRFTAKYCAALHGAELRSCGGSADGVAELDRDGRCRHKRAKRTHGRSPDAAVRRNMDGRMAELDREMTMVQRPERKRVLNDESNGATGRD